MSAEQGALTGRLGQQLAALATTQAGVVSQEQLVALGFDNAAIHRRCTQGWLHRIAPRTYAVGHVGLSRRGRGTAALLHAGHDAGLSHWSSAAAWEMTGERAPEIHLSVIGRTALAVPAGVRLHRPRNLLPEDIVNHRGLRVTTPERTLADLLPELTVVQTTRMLEQMVTHLGRSPDRLHQWGRGLRHVEGKTRLLRALDEIAGPAVLRSEFEARFRSLCQAAGLPAAETNFTIGRWEVDAVFIDQKVAIELDSYRWHGGRWQFHRDRRKGLDINRAGFELIRLSWPQIKHEPELVTETITLALARGEARRRAALLPA